jgi:hypothetical protein
VYTQLAGSAPLRLLATLGTRRQVPKVVKDGVAWQLQEETRMRRQLGIHGFRLPQDGDVWRHTP